MTYTEKSNSLISQLHHNCLDKCLDEARDQDTTFDTKTKAESLKTKTKTKAVKILSRDFTSLDVPCAEAIITKERKSRDQN